MPPALVQGRADAEGSPRMIAWLSGRLLRKEGDAILLAVSGVAFRVFVSRLLLEKLPPEGEPLTLEIHTQVREDAIQLFGFLRREELSIFEVLISLSGIGPKAAMSILSGIDGPELARAVCEGDLGRLCLVPGIGKKKAERLVHELKDKLSVWAEPDSGEGQNHAAAIGELRSALINLGFKPGEMEKTLAALRQNMAQENRLDVLLPEALKLLRG